MASTQFEATSHARSGQMRPTATDVARSEVCVSVSLYVGHTGVLCKNGWTDRDAVWRTDSCGSKVLRILDGSGSPTGRRNFGGCPAH